MFSDAVQEMAQLHAMQQYPKESCGVIFNDIYIPLDNDHDSPKEHFQISNAPQDVQAVIHSHPDGLAAPSASDMRNQYTMDVPWGVLSVTKRDASAITWWGEGVRRKPLLGRTFVHGVADCYSLLRDYYALELGIDVRDFPRDQQWWDHGQDLLNPNNFKLAGFRLVEEEDAREGDVILSAIHSRVMNHCMIYVGNDCILHHLVGRLSRREPLGRWRKFVRHYLRHESR